MLEKKVFQGELVEHKRPGDDVRQGFAQRPPYFNTRVYSGVAKQFIIGKLHFALSCAQCDFPDFAEQQFPDGLLGLLQIVRAQIRYADTLGRTVIQPQEPPVNLAVAYFADRDQVRDEIDANAFIERTDIVEVRLADSVESISEAAFFSCKNLKKIVFSAALVNFAKNAFANCFCLSAIEVPETNKSYRILDGVLFSQDYKELIKYPIGLTRTDYSIPNGVEAIAPYAFAQARCLESIEIPVSVTEIGSNAFDRCNSSTLFYCKTTDSYAWNYCLFNGLRGVVQLENGYWVTANTE
jgi:hypothetical protein